MILTDIRDLLFPRYCKVCGKKLTVTEQHICIGCLRMLPLTHYEQDPLNPMMQCFIGYPSVQRATAWFYYTKGHAYGNLIRDAKYHNAPDTNHYLAKCAATNLLETSFFQDIDLILPVPLSHRRQRQRGYNQSDFIAKGICEVTGIPVMKNNLKRFRDNTHQARLGREARMHNVEGIFRVDNPKALAGHHVLIVDDVITTGATLSSCIDTLAAAVPSIRITLFTLCMAISE